MSQTNRARIPVDLPTFTLTVLMPAMIALGGCSKASQWMTKYGRVSGGAVTSLSEQDEKDLAQLSGGDVKVASLTGEAGATVHGASMTTRQSAEPVLLTLPVGRRLEDELSQSDGVVLVDFYADWCGPCWRQGQILHGLEDTARQHGARIIKVNVDDHPELADQYQVQGIPALVAIRNGQILQQKQGVTQAAALAAMLQL